MTTKMIKTAAATLFCSAALVASGVQAASTGPGLGTKTVNTITQKVWDNPSTTEKEMGVKTLQDYIVQEKEMWDYLFQNHPVFKYAEKGAIKGVYKISTRGSEFLTEGNAQTYSKLAGGHLVGAESNGFQTNCERCHQRSNFVESDYKLPSAQGKLEKGFNIKTKSSCPSCGTEGSQLMMSKHYEKGMRCVTCHDPHEVTSNDWKDYYTKPAIRQTCQDCHKTQADVVANTNTHKKMDCVDCHMPFTMSCENFTAIQRPDMAGFDAVRRSHLFKIEVDPEKKMMNPGAGQSRASNSKGWHVARDEEGHGYVDLMWSCARTANAEKGVMDNKGCHSLFLSELEKGLQYGDQKVIYGEVMKWQNPVKDGFKTAKAALERINKLLEVTKLTVEAKTEIMLLVDKAADITKQVEEDGSWGVHAPDYLKQRVDTANAYLTQAQKILDNGNFPLIKTEAKK